MTLTCAICGQPFTPLTGQAMAKRRYCYGAACARERERQWEERRRARRKERQEAARWDGVC